MIDAVTVLWEETGVESVGLLGVLFGGTVGRPRRRAARGAGASARRAGRVAESDTSARRSGARRSPTSMACDRDSGRPGRRARSADVGSPPARGAHGTGPDVDPRTATVAAGVRAHLRDRPHRGPPHVPRQIVPDRDLAVRIRVEWPRQASRPAARARRGCHPESSSRIRFRPRSGSTTTETPARIGSTLGWSSTSGSRRATIAWAIGALRTTPARTRCEAVPALRRSWRRPRGAVVTVPDGEPRGIVISLAGTGRHNLIGSTLCAHLSQRLVEQGLASVRLDYSGIGDSPGLVPTWVLSDVDAASEQARAVLSASMEAARRRPTSQRSARVTALGSL